MALPTNITAATSGHTAVHNATNAAVNDHEKRITTLETTESGGTSPKQLLGAGRPDIASTLTAEMQAAVAAAPVGTTFSSTDGASVKAWQWQKIDTGWVVTNGDTDWIDLTSIIKNGWTANVIKVKRINGFVEMRWMNLTSTDATDALILTLPNGFYSDDWVRFVANPGGTTPQVIERVTAIIRAGNNAIPSPAIVGAPSNSRYGSTIWSTTNAWPTTLTL